MKEFKQENLDIRTPVLEEAFNQKQIYEFQSLLNKRLYVHHTVIGADAATAGNYGVFWIAPFDCVVESVREVHQTAGSDAGAVTLQIEKLTGTQALDAGTTLLASAIDLKGAANTVVTPALSTTIATNQLLAGDRLALKDSGTLTAVNNVTVLIEIKF